MIHKTRSNEGQSRRPSILAQFTNPVEAYARRMPVADKKTDEVEDKSTKAEFNVTAKVTQGNPLAHEFVDRRIVRITGPIDDAQATNVIAMLHFLDDYGQGDIELRINSPGGSVTAGLAIYDAMKSLNSDVRTVCEGQCASMAAVLLAAGTPGKRSAMPNSTIMVHGPRGGMQGTDIDMNIYMQEVQRLRAILVEIISDYAGLNRADVERMMERDHFMGPQEAKNLGLIDEVIAHRHKAPRAAAANSNIIPMPVARP